MLAHVGLPSLLMLAHAGSVLLSSAACWSAYIPAGLMPARFQIYVLPVCTRMSQCCKSTSVSIWLTVTARSEAHTAYTSSRNTTHRSDDIHWLCAARSAVCCPTTYRIDIRASPCSPPSPWGITYMYYTGTVLPVVL